MEQKYSTPLLSYSRSSEVRGFFISVFFFFGGEFFHEYLEKKYETFAEFKPD